MLKTQQLIFAFALCQLILGGNARSIEENEPEVSQALGYLAFFGKDKVNPQKPTDLINQVTCAACEVLFDDLLELIDSGNVTYEELQDQITEKCIPIIGNEDVCEGFLEISMPSLAYVFNHTAGINGNEICATLFVMIGCVYDNPDRTWVIEPSLTQKPPVNEPAFDYGGDTLKVLHLSDTHFDPLYTSGSNANCPEKYLCCRNDSSESTPANITDAAGFWGDYRSCDAPKWLLEEMYRQIALTHTEISFILWTGDLVAHNLWSTSQSDNLAIIATTANMIKNAFPGIPVFPAVGNHEGHPSNTFAQPYVNETAFDISWLYDELQQTWSDWLPGSTSANIKYGGYYSTMVLDNLKVISVNSNYCYGLNWWLIMDDEDVAAILEFMVAELQASEDIGEKVYIISHHPSGSFDCGRTWSHEYNKIVARYESTITGLFYGHTHNDHFHLFFDPDEPTRVYDVGYIAQSQTPYSNLNPGYKIYTIEGDYEGSMHRVLDHENYIMDLSKVNLDPEQEPTMTLLYTAREEYGLADLSPQSLFGLVQDMAINGSANFDKFYKNYVKDAIPKMTEGCDTKCKEDIICQLVVSDNSDHSRCV